MQKIDSQASLRNAIIQLENKQADEGRRLKEEFHNAYESVKPISLIKNIINQAIGSQELKDNLVSTSFGLTAGLVSKLIFQGLTKNPIKKLVGTALMFGITNVVAKNPEVVKSIGHKLFKIFRKKPAPEDDDAGDNEPA